MCRSLHGLRGKGSLLLHAEALCYELQLEVRDTVSIYLLQLRYSIPVNVIFNNDTFFYTLAQFFALFATP